MALKHPDLIPPSEDWSRSGAQLLKALRKGEGAENFQTMCDDIETLTPQRNLMLYGEWLFQDAGSETAVVSTDPVTIAARPTIRAFEWLAEDVPGKTWIPVVDLMGRAGCQTHGRLGLVQPESVTGSGPNSL